MAAHTIYLSLGANLGDREAALFEALARIEAEGAHVGRVSSLYETEPVEAPDQPWFLNLAAEVESGLLPLQFLRLIQKIERQMGRRRLVAKGPRTLDIDVLLFGQFVIDTAVLTVPHPRMAERRFVLEPMAEIAPDVRHPVLRRTMAELLAAAPHSVVRRVGRQRDGL